jgi:anthranilate 1,2-dioxygenase small subunit
MAATADLERDMALRLRIETLMTDYVYCIDDDRLEAWPDFFVDSGRYRVTTRENHDQNLPVSLIYCDGKGMMRDRISAMRHANIFEPHSYCHMVGAVSLLESGDGWHRTRSNFTVTRTMVDGRMSVFACGKYLDRIVEESGELRFRERDVILESRQIDTLLVIPI